jgi:hypothetical protein
VVPELRPAPVRPAPARNGRAANANDPATTETRVDVADAVALTPDVAGTIADEVARRTELVMLAQRKSADAGELAIDRMRTAFDLHEQERAEYLREWNAIRDLAMEQMKKDDEILKKWIALI